MYPILITNSKTMKLLVLIYTDFVSNINKQIIRLALKYVHRKVLQELFNKTQLMLLKSDYILNHTCLSQILANLQLISLKKIPLLIMYQFQQIIKIFQHINQGSLVFKLMKQEMSSFKTVILQIVVQLLLILQHPTRAKTQK